MTPRRDMHDKRNDWTFERRQHEPLTPNPWLEALGLLAFALGIAAIVPAAYVLHEMVDLLWSWWKV